MLKTTAVISLALLIVVLFGGLTEGKRPGGGEPIPCDGSNIEVRIDDLCGMSKWISVTDSTTACQILCAYNSGGHGKKTSCEFLPLWIGGTVVADPGAPDGYYFDPSTVIVAEVTAEGLQTTLCSIRDDPVRYNGGTWFVHAWFGDIRPL